MTKQTPRNAVSRRAYTGADNIATLLSSNYETQERLTEAQIEGLGGILKPNAKAFPIIRVDKRKVVNQYGKEEVKIKILHYEVYNIEEVDLKGGTPKKSKAPFTKFVNWTGRPMTDKQKKYLTSLLRKVYSELSESEFQKKVKDIEGFTTEEANHSIQELLEITAKAIPS